MLEFQQHLEEISLAYPIMADSGLMICSYGNTISQTNLDGHVRVMLPPS